MKPEAGSSRLMQENGKRSFGLVASTNRRGEQKGVRMFGVAIHWKSTAKDTRNCHEGQITDDPSKERSQRYRILRVG